MPKPSLYNGKPFDPIRWSALLAEGKNVVLSSGPGHTWTAFTCETPEIAVHIVRELHAWSKHEHQSEEFESLCQASD